MYTENELMFPYHAIGALKNLRGPAFAALIERVSACAQVHEESLAFMYMMVKMNGCVSCETDSFRAMRGCLPCAVQTLRRFKGTDEELIAAFEQALREIRQFSMTHPQFGIESPLLPVPQRASA